MQWRFSWAGVLPGGCPLTVLTALVTCGYAPCSCLFLPGFCLFAPGFCLFAVVRFDRWFKNRVDAKSGLGDWTLDENKVRVFKRRYSCRWAWSSSHLPLSMRVPSWLSVPPRVAILLR